MMIKNVKLLFLSVILLLIPFSIIRAEEASSSADEEKVTEKIKEQLEKVVDNDLEKVKSDLINKTSVHYAYFGFINSINNSLLVLNNNGEKYDIEVASQAAIIKSFPKKAKENITIKDLKNDDFIIAMGNKNDKLLEAKRILVTNQPQAAEKRDVLAGKVVEVDTKEITFKSNGDQHNINIGKDTIIKIIGKTEATTDDIQIGDFLAAVVSLDDKDKIIATKVILVIPGEANPASSENNLSSSPSASPKKP